MPALTYKRDKQGVLLDVGVVRDHMELAPIIKLSRDQTLPRRILGGLEGYLNTLPGFVAAAFDDEGNERPPSPDQPMYDLQVARQQHGYLSMQFTRSLQSLADEYGYIFKQQLADVDVLDLVLNRRILVVLIPALEKSEDEAANLGKIVAACLKGMMGATLGNTVEGGWETAIGSKQTRSNSSFMTVFDEVGYYTTQGMAVMAAQARSLGFALVFAAQDLPAMEKRIKTAAKSIVGNCNLKILGRIEDPTETKEFVTKHGGSNWVMETTGFTAPTNTVSGLFMNMPFHDNRGASYQNRQRVDYDHLRGQREGEAHLLFGDWAHRVQMFYAVPEKAKALRVHRFLPVPGVTKSSEARDRAMLELTSRLKDADWSAAGAGGNAKDSPEIGMIVKAVKAAEKASASAIEMGIVAVAAMGKLPPVPKSATTNGTKSTDGKKAEQPKSYGVSDEFDAMDDVSAPRHPAATAALRETDDEAAQGHTTTRAGLPQMDESDAYAIGELERAPGYMAAPGTVAFAGTDADLSAIMPWADGTGEAEDFSATELSDNVKAILAKSAQHMNEGLRGRT